MMPVAAVMPFDYGECGVEGNPASFTLIQQYINQYDSIWQSYYGSQ